jgi:hypothetical protein
LLHVKAEIQYQYALQAIILFLSWALDYQGVIKASFLLVFCILATFVHLAMCKPRHITP